MRFDYVLNLDILILITTQLLLSAQISVFFSILSNVLCKKWIFFRKISQKRTY